jgi:hypothetical protein
MLETLASHRDIGESGFSLSLNAPSLDIGYPLTTTSVLSTAKYAAIPFNTFHYLEQML